MHIVVKLMWNYFSMASLQYFLRRLSPSSGRDAATPPLYLPNGIRDMPVTWCKVKVIKTENTSRFKLINSTQKNHVIIFAKQRRYSLSSHTALPYTQRTNIYAVISRRLSEPSKLKKCSVSPAAATLL